MFIRATLLALCAVSVPFVVSAHVVVSEVAWAGGTDSANAEWIELYNDGAAQPLDGWTLAAADGQPAIALSGTLTADSYALLERTSDETVPGVAAFLIYTGALGNGGEVLELRDAAGILVDRVDGSDGWSIGGDNVTKDTLQRAGDPPTGRWVTAPATPLGPVRTIIPTTAPSEEKENAGVSTVTAASVPSASTQQAPARTPALSITVGDDRDLTAGTPATFVGHLFNERGVETTAASVHWNCGDGATVDGRTVEHMFTYPGDYIVVASARRTGFVADITASARFVAHVHAPDVSIVHADSAYIELANTSDAELDVSGYALAVGHTSFRLSAGTLLLPGAHVRFPAVVTGLKVPAGFSTGLFTPGNALAMLYDPRATTASGERRAAPAPAQTTAIAYARSAHPQVASAEPPTANGTPRAPVAASAGTPENIGTESGAHIARAFDDASDLTAGTARGVSLVWWLLGLVGIVGVVLVAILLIRHEQAEVIEGYEIESDE